MSDINYSITRHTATISVSEYIEGFVDVETFLEACRSCPNYDKRWSCPSYDFRVLDFWKKYKTLNLLASKIIFSEEDRNRNYTQEKINHILDEVLIKEKERLSLELFKEEEKYPGSISLSAGSCTKCTVCSRETGKPCLYPDKMRYSIESLGGNVGLTIEKLMGLHLEWMEEGRLPHHFVLVCGLLLP